jgi:hypothetical protein
VDINLLQVLSGPIENFPGKVTEATSLRPKDSATLPGMHSCVWGVSTPQLLQGSWVLGFYSSEAVCLPVGLLRQDENIE